MLKPALCLESQVTGWQAMPCCRAKCRATGNGSEAGTREALCGATHAWTGSRVHLQSSQHLLSRQALDPQLECS